MALLGAPAWINYLERVELPVLSNTMRSICLITESEKVKIEELVKVILNDADLTSKVLKLANSACYNPMRMPSSTMSRAIVQIGFDSIKAIAISSALVDNLLKKNNQTQLFHCLVRSFHAAVQAKYLAADYPAEEQEAIFIAALLFDVGEAAFWSCDSSVTSVLEDRLHGHANQYVDEQKALLGTSFRAISRGLAKNWHLGPLLEECLHSPTSRQARIVCAAVDLAHYHEFGNPQQQDSMLKGLALLTDKSNATLKSELAKNTAKAANLAEQFGIKGARSYLKAQPQNRKSTQADTQKQFEALLHISESIASGQAWDETLNLILQSIHQTVGIERCALFIAKPGSMHFKIFKYSGYATKEWLAKPELYVKPIHPFHDILQQQETKRVPNHVCLRQPDAAQSEAAPFSGLIDSALGSFNWAGHFHGFVYIDRLNQAELENTQLASFRLFMQQIQLLFTKQ